MLGARERRGDVHNRELSMAWRAWAFVHYFVFTDGALAPLLALQIAAPALGFAGLRAYAGAAGFLDKSEVTDRVIHVVKNFQKVDPGKVRLHMTSGIPTPRHGGNSQPTRRTIVVAAAVGLSPTDAPRWLPPGPVMRRIWDVSQYRRCVYPGPRAQINPFVYFTLSLPSWQDTRAPRALSFGTFGCGGGAGGVGG